MKTLVLLFFLPFFLFSAFSQSLTVYICTRMDDSGHLEIVLTPSQDFEGAISNVQFTLVTEGTGDSLFGDIIKVDTLATRIPVVKAGEVFKKEGKQYQKFVGFGDKTLKSLDQKWEANQEMILFTLSPTSDDAPEITVGNDSQTNDRIFNGVFYVEANFRDVTGKIGECATTIDVEEETN